jgi:hypothetical protein
MLRSYSTWCAENVVKIHCELFILSFWMLLYFVMRLNVAVNFSIWVLSTCGCENSLTWPSLFDTFVSCRPCLTLDVVTYFHVAVQRKKQAEKCVGYALSCCSVQLPAPLPPDILIAMWLTYWRVKQELAVNNALIQLDHLKPHILN